MVTKARKRAFQIVQVLISLAATVYVVIRLARFEEWSAFGDMLYENRGFFVLLLMAQCCLLALNLGLEGLKWQTLSSPVLKQSYRNALIQVLKGLQFGIVTPARAGEPLAKAYLAPLGNRTRAFLLSVSGSILQNLVLATGGIFGIMLFTGISDGDGSVFQSLREGVARYISYFVVGLIVISLVFFRVLRYFRNHPFVRRVISYLLVIRQLGKKRVLTITAYTVARYFVYCFQLWLILHFFKIVAQPGDLWLVAIYFASITFIPSIAIADLGIRSSVALFLFGILSYNSAGIVASVFLLWCFNIAVPAFVAAFFLPRATETLKPPG